MKFLPAILVESTEQVYLGTVNRRSLTIYNACCLFLCALILYSFFLKIPISVISSAVIRPTSEVSSIRSLVSGRIKESFIGENQSVKKGDILYLLESEVQQEREKLLLLKKQETKLFIADLTKVIGGSANNRLSTSLYGQALFNYRQKINDATTRLRKVQIDYKRNLKLHREKVIADAEFENFQFELDKARNDLELVNQTQLSTWQSEIRNYQLQLQDIEGELAQLNKENENLTIKAPVSGTVQNVAGVYAGSLVFANQDLAQISPDTSLIVEAYISPTDIGLIRNGMQVRFQVSAFNYNQWGLATGAVLEVSSDVQIINDQPVFKVRCKLDNDYLNLKNGYRGYLKKGMILQARFTVTERTLWQLLYDKVDDWLNPNTFIN